MNKRTGEIEYPRQCGCECKEKGYLTATGNTTGNATGNATINWRSGTVELLKSKFIERYGGTAQGLRVFRAPGRVNLIGEHTDYNDGFVLPAAIDREFLMVVRPRDDGHVRIYSANMKSETEFGLSSIEKIEGRWGNYVRGVAVRLLERGFALKGFDGVLSSTVPTASGLSSSAALEVLAARVFEALSGFVMDAVEQAKACQRAENEFIGVKCGIMDQFISRLGKKGNALLIDCRSLRYEHVPIPEGVRIIIVDTGVKRQLASSAYNERRAQCEEAVRAMARHKPGAAALRDFTLEEFEQRKCELPEIVAKRARHVISENERVLAAVDALRKNDVKTFGKLMYASHKSLRDDYGVGCRELDTIVEAARKTTGVFGARMTGAGFGGCGVILAKAEAAEDVVKRVGDEYEKMIGKRPEIYVCTAEDGAGEIE